jgi:hypothetical protein
MRNTDSIKDMMIVKKLRADDPIELPMDESFFDKLHGNIMQAVAKTEVKPLSKWDKAWVFLEQKSVHIVRK